MSRRPSCNYGPPPYLASLRWLELADLAIDELKKQRKKQSYFENQCKSRSVGAKVR
jgi:hypothetical protein